MQETSDSDTAAVVFRNVSVKRGSTIILENISASAPRSGSSAIVGPNGAGKTTLLQALLGEISFEGEIVFKEFEDGRRPRIGYVPQRLLFDRGMPLTVRDFMLMGLQWRPLWLGSAARQRRHARELLAAVQAEKLENRQMGVLSGGELQRVLLALALQQKPELLVLDEPAAGVDVRGGALFCEVLERLRSELGFTQLMVSHDLSTVTHHATHAILLNHRVIAEGPPRKVLTPENLESLFGLHMGLANASSMPGGKTSCTCNIHPQKSNQHA